jgi:DNA-binding NarL/FixJ family response regulator
MSTPRYVVGSAAEAAGALRRLARAGWHAREGFALPDHAWDVTAQRLVLYGRVGDEDAAELAVHAAARGAAVVLIADPDTELGRTLLADLGRLGPVTRDADAEVAFANNNSPILLPEQRALLERLANGETIAAAAAAEYLSLRTANRRIAQARQVLGVRTTREAVLAFLRQRRPS